MYFHVRCPDAAGAITEVSDGRLLLETVLYGCILLTHTINRGAK